MTLNLERLLLTETVHTSCLGERLRLRLMALLLILAGKCSSRRAKSAHVGCHLPHASGNGFILPVMPDLGLQGMEREQLKFNLTSCV
jgi:hypothetical protein